MSKHVPEHVHGGAEVGHGGMGDVVDPLIPHMVSPPVMDSNNCQVGYSQVVSFDLFLVLTQPLKHETEQFRKLI